MSFVFSVVLSSIQFWVAIRVSTAILWQVKLMQYFAGPGPLLEYKNGQPIYEGTPVHLIAACIGLVMGVIVYWLVGYFIIKWHNKRMQAIGQKVASH
jgi:hypothetical protein